MNFDIVIIGGLGHVGLPLGLMWADAGFTVGLYDTDETKRALLGKGRMPFIEYGAEPILEQVLNKKLFIPEAITCIRKAKHVVITVGTPVDEYLTPQFVGMDKLAASLADNLSDGQHVVLRSTVFPGTTERLHRIFQERGIDIHISFCPERIVQGHAVKELKTLPHIISSFSEKGYELAEGLFSKLNPHMVKIGVKEAELAKLYANSWRYISFAVANQFYMVAEAGGADIKEIYRALKENYPRGKDIPTPGYAAGPCLLKDTMQLCAFYSNHFQMGYAAMQINEGLPTFCVEHIKKSIDLRGKKVGLLGMAFKAEVDDIRDSLSFKLRKLLLFHGAKVLCSDEYVESDQFHSLSEVLKEADLFIIGVPHKRYQEVSFPKDKPVYNIWDMDMAGLPK
jgi:UDP-N-acetyl-D-mannosaminuronic acid dehydrogenase